MQGGDYDVAKNGNDDLKGMSDKKNGVVAMYCRF